MTPVLISTGFSNTIFCCFAFAAIGMLAAIMLVYWLILKKDRITVFLSALLFFILIRIFFTEDVLSLLNLFHPELNSIAIVFGGCIYVSGILYLSKSNGCGISKLEAVILCVTSVTSIVLCLAFLSRGLYPVVVLVFRILTILVCLAILLKIVIKGARNLPNALNIAAATLIFAGVLMSSLESYGLSVKGADGIFMLLCMTGVLMQLFGYGQNARLFKKSEMEIIAAKNESEQAKISLLLSQIRPHFLYNALNAVKYLYRKSIENGEDALLKFSNYLRANMSSITSENPIYFEKELDHIKNYAEIELIRFGDRLKVEYDIKVHDFFIPPLSVQPLVENAIKHGVCSKIEGGKVILRTSKVQNNIIIEVIDDGIGFEVEKQTNESGGFKSIGLGNITKRLKMVSNASLNIQSVPGKGTWAAISLPAFASKEENNENHGRR